MVFFSPVNVTRFDSLTRSSHINPIPFYHSTVSTELIPDIYYLVDSSIVFPPFNEVSTKEEMNKGLIESKSSLINSDGTLETVSKRKGKNKLVRQTKD